MRSRLAASGHRRVRPTLRISQEENIDGICVCAEKDEYVSHSAVTSAKGACVGDESAPTAMKREAAASEELRRRALNIKKKEERNLKMILMILFRNRNRIRVIAHPPLALMKMIVTQT